MTQAAATIPRLDNREAMPPSLRGAIIAMGNFDGFHRGHQAVVGRAIQWARDEGRPAIVATFDPHPMRLFQPDAEPFRLTTLDQRQRLFAAAGADAMLVFHFDHELASHSAAEFIDMLVTHMGAAGVVTGEDFTFGRGRSGSVATLAELGPAAGLRNEAVAPVTSDKGEIVSSSLIREALKSGDCATATRLLSRPFAVQGVVQHGDKFGRKLNFPTANIDMGPYLRPAYGVYAVRGLLPGGWVVDGAANLGIRPMIDPPREVLEPHFFDFSGDLYGQTIEVQMIAWLRGEGKFDGFEALQHQIALDCEHARQILAETPLVA
ncbi:riboflavin biosynthesis protein [Sphingobium jiangsuense]|uniref:Riboflavin biosynthesis protein n=1 Tax=Sphingobium jiangsuense TaxID=870476 RepID=A0A7W6BR14_9SPHN|nr:bifunctional riboflavin kinase/FAD synthetase [Sphingobium jiangsuense]MBB3928465.1 riboflavin kinase/FMN adenylyltransferase [Sphingobium jiangsuense]GLT01093.1 riboflavin biosynthesis protein [Sphingobium jiangsuense]